MENFNKIKEIYQWLSEIPDHIKGIIALCIKRLEENRIPVNQEILFGSYATDGFTEWSDIDLAIVSDAFEDSREKAIFQEPGSFSALRRWHP